MKIGELRMPRGGCEMEWGKGGRMPDPHPCESIGTPHPHFSYIGSRGYTLVLLEKEQGAE